MRIIDARNGDDVIVGRRVVYPRDPESSYTLIRFEPGVFHARGIFRYNDGRIEAVKMPVRYLHPGFLFQQVAFVPS